MVYTSTGMNTRIKLQGIRMIRTRLLAFVLLLTGIWPQAVFSENIKVGVVQTVIEDSLQKNCTKLLSFIGQAKAEGCQIVIFPEGALYWSDVAVERPSRTDLDRAIARVGRKADAEDVYVVFGVGYKTTDPGPYLNRGVVFDPGGERLLFYKKNAEVPQRFDVYGIPFNLSICSDRGYLEHSDLPCLVQGSQVIVDISGGHGGDDGRPDLRWIRYRPWAMRTGAYVIVSNPVHDDTDFMGHSPWGGGSAVIRPDGSIQACRTYEKDSLIVEEIDTAKATRLEAIQRRNHPIFKAFWDMGEQLLEGDKVDSIPDMTPYSSARRDITIAAVQMICSRDMSENVKKIKRYIHEAAGQGGDIVVFPELAMTGIQTDDVLKVQRSELQRALGEIRSKADNDNIYVIVGTPCFVDHQRRNCAFVIGDDGSIKTRYDQISTIRDDVFQAGSDIKAMWFELKGVHSIVTIGEDVNFVEIADLAAARGMVLHFHMTHEVGSSSKEITLLKQRHLLMLTYATFGAVVNAGGMSMIVSREGGHNKPAPNGVEYYLPYQTSIIKSAGSAETMILATRKTPARNDTDLLAYWRNRNRRRRTQTGWYDWIKKGALLIDK